MMKKEYVAPTVEVVEMEMASMLAGSVTDNENVGGNPDVEPDGELSNRRRNFWDEIGGR